MMDNEDSNEMPDWVRDPINPPIGTIKKENENSRLLKRQSILRGNGKRESIGSMNMSPQQVVVNEYEDDDIECFGSFFDPVLLWFRTFHTLSLLCGLACACANLYVLSKITTSSIITTVSIRDISIRIYTVICSLLIVITEGDWRYIMHRVRILDLWFFRGFYYAFVPADAVSPPFC